MAGRYNSPVLHTVPLGYMYIGWPNRFQGSLNVSKFALSLQITGVFYHAEDRLGHRVVEDMIK
jgi:hypothetical protein